jgi:hypothetical protein
MIDGLQTQFFRYLCFNGRLFERRNEQPRFSWIRSPAKQNGSNYGINPREMSGIPSSRGAATARNFVQAIGDQID